MTCLDPRCVPENFLGHDIGLPVIRNAGGRATEDAIRSLVILRYLIGASAVLVIHHTGNNYFSSLLTFTTAQMILLLTIDCADCGKTHITADEIHDGAKEKTPDALAEVDAIQYRLGPASNFEKMIREDVDILRSTKALAGLDIRGFALDTVTGVMTQLKG